MTTTEPQLVEVKAHPIIEIRRTVPMAEIQAFYDRAFKSLSAYISANGARVSGAPLGISHGMPSDTIDLSVAFPVVRPVEGEGEIKPSAIPSGTAASLTVTGAYETIGPAYGELQKWMVDNGHEPGPLAWEQYLTIPEPGGDPSLNVTRLFWLLATE